MRYHLAAFVLGVTIFAWANVFADEYATTDRGQRVLLKSDGTWTRTEQTNQSNGAGDFNQVIRGHCAQEWPNDFRMRAYCESQQRAGVRALLAGKPDDISPTEFTIVRDKCAAEWPDDFRMRDYCEQQQFKGIRQLSK